MTAIRSVTGIANAGARMSKGHNLVDLAKMVRAKRQVQSLAGLLDEDRVLISGLVMPGGWYAFESFQRILDVVHQSIMGGRMEDAYQMGQRNAAAVLHGAFAVHLRPGDPAGTVTCLERIWPQLFNFGSVNAQRQGDHAARVLLEGYPDMHRTHGLVIVGWLRHAAELAGGKAVSSDFRQAPWDGAAAFEVRLAWQQ